MAAITLGRVTYYFHRVTDLTKRAFRLVVRALNAEPFLSLHQTFFDDRQRQLGLTQGLLQDPDVLLATSPAHNGQQLQKRHHNHHLLRQVDKTTMYEVATYGEMEVILLLYYFKIILPRVVKIPGVKNNFIKEVGISGV